MLCLKKYLFFDISQKQQDEGNKLIKNTSLLIMENEHLKNIYGIL